METLLSCHPKDLPKLKDKTVLNLPITISIAIPTEKVSLWRMIFRSEASIVSWQYQETLKFDRFFLKTSYPIVKETEIYDMTIIKKFYKHRSRGGLPGFNIVFQNDNANSYFLLQKYYLLNNQYLIQPLEILNLLNNAKLTTNNQIIFLSMDNFDNVLDIGW